VCGPTAPSPARGPVRRWAAASARSSTSAPAPHLAERARDRPRGGAGRTRRVRRQRPDRETRHAQRRLLSHSGETGVVLATCATRGPSWTTPRSVASSTSTSRSPCSLSPSSNFLIPTRSSPGRDRRHPCAEALPAGSFLVLSHATGDFADRRDAQAVYSRATASLSLRSRAESSGSSTVSSSSSPASAQALLAPGRLAPGTIPRDRLLRGVARKTG